MYGVQQDFGRRLLAASPGFLRVSTQLSCRVGDVQNFRLRDLGGCYAADASGYY